MTPRPATTAASAPAGDAPADRQTIGRQVILFSTAWGRYLITRDERYRLARLHGIAEAQARQLAYDGAAVPDGRLAAERVGTFTAHELARRFDAEGQPRDNALPGLRRAPLPDDSTPARTMTATVPAVAGAGRAGV